MLKKIRLLILPLLWLPGLTLAVTEAKVGEPLPEQTLYGFGGDVLKLSELRGKPLIINVWASWCGPCRAEMGSLQRLANRYGGKQLNVIGISVDDDSHAALDFLMKTGVTFDNYADDRQYTMETLLGASSIPLTVLLDSQGRILKKVYGFHQWDSAETINMIGQVFGQKL